MAASSQPTHQPAQRSPQPIHLTNSQTREKHGHVVEVDGVAVIGLVLQPVAQAAAGEVRTYYLVDIQKCLSKRIEIPPVAGETMDADEHPLIVRVAPLGVV